MEKIEQILKDFNEGLSLLDDYDNKTLKKPIGSLSSSSLDYSEAKEVIEQMKFKTDIFGVEKERGKLEGILSAIELTAFGKEVYATAEEKAANLLYFLIKDHPFVDGCKRIAAALFLCYLDKNGLLYKDGKKILSNASLAAFVILIAQSNPKEKDVMVLLVQNAICCQ